MVCVLLPILGLNILVIFCKTFQTRIQVLYTVHNDTLTCISLKVQDFWDITWCHISEEVDLQLHCYENLKSHISTCSYYLLIYFENNPHS